MRFTDVLNDLNIPYREGGSHRHVSQGWIGIDCPWCGETDGFHLGYNLSHGHLNCWRCGSHRPAEALAEITGKPLRECIALLGGIYREQERRQAPPPGKLELPTGLGPLLKPHKDYLRQRGFDPDQLARLWGLLGIGLSSRLAWRIFIPVKHHSLTVSWTSRSLVDHGQRYMSAAQHQEAMPAKELLFGEDFCRHACIVVEGPFDVFRVGPGAVATLGLRTTRAQVQRISKYPVRCICFDSDDQAQQRARQLADELAVFPGETHVATLGSKDPGSADDAEVAELRKRFLE